MNLISLIAMLIIDVSCFLLDGVKSKALFDVLSFMNLVSLIAMLIIDVFC